MGAPERTVTRDDLLFGVLGPFEVRRGDELLALGGRRQRAVLACLVLEAGHVVSVDRLADAIWGDRPPPSVLTSLQTYVFHLREALEPNRMKGGAPHVLVTLAGGYRLDVGPQSVDATRFEDGVEAGRQALVEHRPDDAYAALSEALGLWRGDVLADLGDLPTVAAAASPLDELRLTATEMWARAGLELGRHGALAPALRRLTEAHPLREGLHVALMLALYRSGRQAEALDAYRRLRGVLTDELGVDPGPEASDLHGRILRQDPGLLLPAATAPAIVHADQPAAGTDRAVAGGSASAAGRPSRRPSARRRLPKRSVAAVAATLLVAAAALAGGVFLLGRRGEPLAVPPNVVAAMSARGLEGAPVPLPSGASAMATTPGAVWAADEGGDALVRIDPVDHRVVQTIHGVGGAPTAVAAAGDDVWVTGSNESVVSRVSTLTNQVVQKVPVGNQPSALVATGTDVWVANTGDDTIQRIDPGTGTAGTPITVGDGPAGLALDGTTLWIANSRSATVSRFDTRQGQPAAADIAVDAGPRGLTVTASDVWVANELAQSVSRIDRSTGRVRTIPVEDGPTSVVVLDQDAWVNNASSGSVSRIETATDVVSRVSLGSAPQSMTSADGQLWVATRAFGNADHAGGTLTWEQFQSEPGSLDPTTFHDIAATALLQHVYDGLVAFRSSGGQAGETLVPDLATSLPRPTDGGRTYVFTVRPNIHYSTGAVVHASDFVRGLRRAVANPNGNPGLFRSIVGAAACIDSGASADACDLAGGVDADDTTGRLTFHLLRADPELPAKLPDGLVPTPPGSPLTDVGLSGAIPGTGPYMVSSTEPNGGFTLQRNPYFAQWSFSAQPAGYPDVLRFQVSPAPDTAVADVVAGRADITQALPAQMAGLVAHAALVHSFDHLNTDFVYLNAHLPPFDDVRVRRALNFAVDRRELVALYGGGSSAAKPSCQLLPTPYPGRRSYCPYQTGAPSGPYLGPDVDRARGLVRDSGTAGTPITIHAYRGVPLWGAFPDYFATVLRSIGFTSVTVEDIADEHAAYNVADPAYEGYQIFSQQGWIGDYLGASSFYDQFSCHNHNITRYCNQAAEAAAGEALLLEQTDPTAALDRWAEVDRMLTDDGAFVTLGNRQATQVVSARVGNYLARPGPGGVVSQLWVR